jgi:antitoxin Phd
MRRWQLQDAKNRFSDVVNRAQSEGPQIVTKRGVERAVVLSYDDYRQLTGQKMSFKDYLLCGPSFEGLDLERPKEPSRDVEL